MNGIQTTARGTSDTIMPMEGQQNAGGVARFVEGKAYYDSAPLSDYPRMLYRKTEVEQVQTMVDAVLNLKDAPNVINRFDGYLCDTCIAQSATEAEALAELGWDVSPRTAYGLSDGLVTATSAKDEEIARLRALLAEGAAPTPDASDLPRRGPGRPRNTPEPV